MKVKKHIYTATLIAAASLLASSLSAQTTIIGSGGTADSGTFDTIGSWTTGDLTGISNITRELTTASVSSTTNNPFTNLDPSQAPSLNVYTNSTATSLGGILNTGYELQSGDLLNLDFEWGTHPTSYTDATVGYVLFTSSDNTLGGTLSAIYEGATGVNAGSIEAVSVSNITVGGSHAGQELFIGFGLASGGNTEYMYVDNVGLTAIPEPSTFALLGGTLALFWVALRRRRA